MHKVIFKDGHTSLMSDSKANKIVLFRKQGMLNARQSLWLETVKEIIKLRNAPDHQTIVKTKDMVCNCKDCE